MIVAEQLYEDQLLTAVFPSRIVNELNAHFFNSIGNMYKNRLSLIWNLERHNKVINLLDIEHRIGNCKSCRSITYNGAIHKFIQSGEWGSYYDPFL
jgi:hypothetical protein